MYVLYFHEMYNLIRFHNYDYLLVMRIIPAGELKIIELAEKALSNIVDKIDILLQINRIAISISKFILQMNDGYIYSLAPFMNHSQLLCTCST